MHKILTILEAVSACKGDISLSQLRNDTQLPSATLNRLIRDMVENGYLTKSSHGFYEAGPALTAMAANICANWSTKNFDTVLSRLANISGLNAELYSLGKNGPVFIKRINIQSEFRVRMNPGYHPTSPGNPVYAFYCSVYPESSYIWDKKIIMDENLEKWLKLCKEENFIYEQGNILPELARACSATNDKQYCIGLSGLISEFKFEPEKIKQLLNEAIRS